MKRSLLSSLLLLAGILVFAQRPIKDANVQERTVKSFHGINIGYAFEVQMSQGNEEAVAVSCSDEKFVDRITVEVKDGILNIGLDKGWKYHNKKFKAYISFRTLDKLSISGACDVFVSGSIKSESLRINLSGASDLKTKLDVTKLNVDLSGASDMTVQGNASQMSIEASGASKFKGFDLRTDFCNANASGASDIKITVNKELSVHASGASDIDYKGEGVIRDLKTSGASSVSKAKS